LALLLEYLRDVRIKSGDLDLIPSNANRNVRTVAGVLSASGDGTEVQRTLPRGDALGEAPTAVTERGHYGHRLFGTSS
jgi:hypothetical protein